MAAVAIMQPAAQQPVIIDEAELPQAPSRRRSRWNKSRDREPDGRRTSNSFAIASLVISALSVLTMCVPVIGLIVPLIGLALAVVGFLVASSRGGAGIGFAIAGGLLSCLAIIPQALIALAVIGAPAAQRVGDAASADTESPVHLAADSPRNRHFVEIETPNTPESEKTVLQNVVTKANYDRIKNGMSYAQVVAIIGSEGEEQSSNHIDGVPGVMKSIDTVMYHWRNRLGSGMIVMFQNDKMIQKSQFGLR